MENNKSVMDIFFNNVVKNRIHVVIYLLNGVKLKGYICYFDDSSFILYKDYNFNMVYIHAVLTILPSDEQPRRKRQGIQH